MHLRLTTALIGVVVLATFGATAALAYNDTNADGSINFGSANLFTALTSGDLNDTNNQFTGPSLITGNVGIGGKGNFSMSDGTINGDFYMNDYGTLTTSGPANITGHKHGLHLDGISQQTTLNNALSDAMSLSSAAAAEANTSNYNVTAGSFTQGGNVNISNPNANITISDKNPFGGSKIVLSINNFVLSNGTFTLSGTAATTYIVNVSGQFNINNSTVIATGGLLASHILFNFTGTQQSAGTITMQQGTTLTGTLLAANRQVDLSGGKVYGKVIAEQLTITSGGQVVSQ